MILKNIPIEAEGAAPARRGAAPTGVGLDQWIGARLQDIKTVWRAVVKSREHGTASGKPEGNGTLMRPFACGSRYR